MKWFLDNTLEFVVLACRVLAAAGSGVAFGLVTAAIWIPERWPSLIGTAALVTTAAIGLGYLGFYVWGNEDWRRRGEADR